MNAPPPETDDFLVEAEQLYDLIKKEHLVVIDTRDEAVFRQSHIPGARNISEIFYYLCTKETGGLPGLQSFFSNKFSQAGIQPDHQVIIYEDAMDNGYGKSCRGWLLLNYLGHSNVRVLHGGFRGWQAKKLPLTSEIQVPLPFEFKMHLQQDLIVSDQEMLSAIDHPEIVIVDCRDYAEWNGANSSPYGYDYCPRKGRIPRAIWIEWYRMMTREKGIPWFRKSDEIKSICAEAGIHPESTVFVYCFKGARASTLVLALKRAGIKDVRNYFSSWNEWSRDFTLPVDEDYPDNS